MKAGKKYNIIYADPPWKYQGEMMNSSATDHYKTMDIEKLKKYNIIYADPPWKFKTWSEKGLKKSAENHYKTLETNDICNIPIKDLAADNCILFIWVTMPKLNEVFDLIKAWGFEYKTVGFTWIKKNKKADSYFFGLGRWTRANPELCLLATKGKIKRVSAGVPQLVVSKIREHSRKPDEIRDKIVELVGDLPRIELFARQKWEGWDAWGNEAPKEMQKSLISIKTEEIENSTINTGKSCPDTLKSLQTPPYELNSKAQDTSNEEKEVSE